jgi:thiol-disulfide isomerase/thioredoxin
MAPEVDSRYDTPVKSTDWEAVMRTIRYLLLPVVLAVIAVIVGNRPGASPNDGVTLQVIRYDDLTDRIQGLTGQVVVVDFWADYCLPCKREFPRLVELHRKYARAGLTAVSVSLDDSTDEDARDRVTKFLTARKATFPNYLLAEKSPVWQAKLKIDGPPCVFVFNRKGELLKKYQDDVDYGEIERIVTDALKQ